MKWEIDTTQADFVKPWKISGAEVSSKKIIYVKATKGDYTGVGEVTYGSKEEIDIDILKNDLENFSYIYKDNTVAQFNEMARLLEEVDFECKRIRFAIEAAFLDYLAKATEIPPWRIIGTNTIKSVNSFSSISLFDTTDEGKQLLEDASSAQMYKLKISKETFDSQLELINNMDVPFCLDANESWEADAEGFLAAVGKITNDKILFIEQPLEKMCLDGYRKLKNESKIDIFLDETVQDHKHLNVFVELCHGIVLKAPKSLSIMRVVSQMDQAKKLGLKTMLGCMVESDVGIASLFSVAYGFDYYDFDGFTKLKSDVNDKVFWDNGKVVLASMN
jgi:glutamate racemase